MFVDEDIEKVISLLDEGIIDAAQLHGSEGDEYISVLKKNTGKEIIKAFKIKSEDDIERAEESTADYVLLDSGEGSGKTFDWDLIKEIKREYFLAGGLDTENAEEAVRTLRPYAVDVSSGIETDGIKDKRKMADFVSAVRRADIK